jgi:hypothetical protein
MFCCGTPRSSRAWVKGPVTGPSSRIGPVLGVMSWVIREATALPEGVTAATRSGLLIQARKNARASDTGIATSLDRGLLDRTDASFGGLFDESR